MDSITGSREILQTDSRVNTPWSSLSVCVVRLAQYGLWEIVLWTLVC